MWNENNKNFLKFLIGAAGLLLNIGGFMCFGIYALFLYAAEIVCAIAALAYIIKKPRKRTKNAVLQGPKIFKKRIAFSALAVLLVGVIALNTGMLAAFFSDNISGGANITIGNLRVLVNNLQVSTNTDPANLLAPEVTKKTRVALRPDRISMFTFDVENAGMSSLTADVYLNICFANAALGEQGIILVYPASVPNSTITAEVANNQDTSAVIKLTASDTTSIDTAEGTFNGIRQKVDTVVLDSMSGPVIVGATQRSYAYKLVFVEGDVTTYEHYYDTLEVGVEALASYEAWTDDDRDDFHVETTMPIRGVEDGLVLFYDGCNNLHMGKNPNTLTWKDLIGRNDGTLEDGPVWELDNLKFDGANDKVVFKGDVPPQRYTMVVTFLYDSTGTASYPRLSAEPNFPSLYLIPSSNPANHRFGIFAQGIDTTFAGSNYQANTFTQATITYDVTVPGSSVKLYVDGVYQDELPYSVDPTSTILAYLGNRAANNRGFKGNIYDFRIYDRVLDATEIMDVYTDELNRNVIPISSVTNFKKIGNNEIIKINGKYYHFSPDAIYRVTENLSFTNSGRWYPVISSIGRINTYDKIVTIIDGADEHYFQNQLYVTENNAVKDGLILHYDSIKNTRTGYNPAAAIWEDLQGTNDGTIFGAGWSGGGLDFSNVNDRVEYIGDITNEYTMVVTIKPVLSGTYPRFFAERAFPTLYLHSDKKYAFGFYSFDVDTTFSPATIPSATENTYVIMTYDGTNVTLYTDGKKAGTVQTSVPPTSTLIAYLGNRGGFDRSYTGKIFDYMIYDRVFSDFEAERSTITNKTKY